MADNTTGFESKSLQDVGVGYYASYDKFIWSFYFRIKYLC
jgi:hypothetical protein